MQTVKPSHSDRASAAHAVAQPLTHHEIAQLVGPFARRGRHVDLQRSDRAKRRLVFRTIRHTGDQPLLETIDETLELENQTVGLFRVTRVLTLPNGLTATLSGEGPDSDALVAAIDTVPPLRHFRVLDGVVVASSYRLAPSEPSVQHTLPSQPVFTHGEALVGGMRLLVRDARVVGYSADVHLLPEPGCSFQLPEDLLAVLGKAWGVLRRRAPGWRSSLYIRGSRLARGAVLESEFCRAVAHLNATFAATPADFHEKQRNARWGVVYRRAQPILLFFVLIAGAGILAMLKALDDGTMRFVVAAAPGMLLFGAFAWPNRPAVEIPSLPRRPSVAAWHDAADRLPTP